jgi:hypothetical protein
MAYLVVIGSVVVFLLYVVVLRYWAASRASYGFVIIPFVSLVLSASLDNELVGVGLVVGGLLVLAGVYVGALRPARVPQRLWIRRLTRTVQRAPVAFSLLIVVEGVEGEWVRSPVHVGPRQPAASSP